VNRSQRYKEGMWIGSEQKKKNLLLKFLLLGQFALRLLEFYKNVIAVKGSGLTTSSAFFPVSRMQEKCDTPRVPLFERHAAIWIAQRRLEQFYQAL